MLPRALRVKQIFAHIIVVFSMVVFISWLPPTLKATESKIDIQVAEGVQLSV
jgi:hypothetical protein